MKRAHRVIKVSKLNANWPGQSLTAERRAWTSYRGQIDKERERERELGLSWPKDTRARGRWWNFLEIFPVVGHINSKRDRRRCKENISERRCHGCRRIPSSAIPKMDKPKRGIRSRASDLPRRTSTRSLSQTYREMSAFSILRIRHFTSDRSREKRGRREKERERRKGGRGEDETVEAKADTRAATSRGDRLNFIFLRG